MAATSDGGQVQISQRLADMQFVGYLALGRYLQYFGIEIYSFQYLHVCVWNFKMKFVNDIMKKFNS